MQAGLDKGFLEKVFVFRFLKVFKGF